MSGACRFCARPLRESFADLGMSPLSNAFVRADQRGRMEPFYPLHARVCDGCFLVQLEEFETPARIFDEYVYFSSFSDSWLDHARRYSEAIIDRCGLDASSFVVEVASNDGYLLRNFVQRGIPVLGVEPAYTVARAAVAAGVPTLQAFFDADAAARIVTEHRRADLIVANNVLAHVPDLNAFVAGFGRLLAPDGLLTVEVPHLLRLIEGVQFDTIYHEHFSYFSLTTAGRVFAAHGLAITDVEELPTHGGSLRLHVRHEGTPPSPAVAELEARERDTGLRDPAVYRTFQARVDALKRDLLAFLIEARRDGRRIAAYGAPAKGNTLLNYCGIRTDFVEFTVDRSPHKQGMLLPGSHIPVYAPERIEAERPDYILVLPWNLLEEVRARLATAARWGGRLVVPVPAVRVLE